MKFTTVTSVDLLDVAHFPTTCKRDTIICDYKTLTTLFGRPALIESGEGDDKVDAEWYLVVTEEDGERHHVTVYNWKNGHNYLRWAGTPVDEIREWNIGGDSSVGALIVSEMIRGLEAEAKASRC